MASLLDRRALPLLFLLAACAIATDVRYCSNRIPIHCSSPSRISLLFDFVVLGGTIPDPTYPAAEPEKIKRSDINREVGLSAFSTEMLMAMLCSNDLIRAIRWLEGVREKGSYTLTMRMAGEDGEQLTCITFGFSIGFVVPVADN
ncbi:ML domain protein [Musa troglodytarum]|uniref:ML domain protein n=1 Tax=Musa troglodytarum TaxID=320322 RepID=A0A9E7FRS2_9LILI|nr:ML domain protein [Musa troglodytarum]